MTGPVVVGGVPDGVLPLDPGGPLAHVVRGPLVESVHLGHLVVLDPAGEVALAVGDPEVVIWPRSSLKPLQAVAMLRAGLEIDPEGLALACSSHSGEPGHLDGVRRVLASVGHDPSDLATTPDLPLGADAARAWLAEGRGPEAFAHNCSGKHAAMIAASAAAGWTTTGYLRADHPVQRAVRAGVEELTGVPAEHVTVDGCGAPLLSTTLRGLAHGFARVATTAAADPGSPEGRVVGAVTGHPWLVGGTGRDVTAFLGAVPGLLAKDGAEGVYAGALPCGTAVALKMSDGSSRARATVMAGALEVALAVSAAADAGGAPSAEVVAAVREVGRTPVLGHGAPVGEVVVGFEVPGRFGRSR